MSAAAIEQYIRASAQRRGIDPNIAVRVARSEGLSPGVWQSNLTKNGVREPSYGPFQLLVGGPGTGYPAGMGNDFVKRTGLDPTDPSTVNAQVDFALDNAKKGGWGPWYGAAKVGVNKWDGINASAPTKPNPTISPEAQSFVDNNPQPGGYGPGINDPNAQPNWGNPQQGSTQSPFGSMAPLPDHVLQGSVTPPPEGVTPGDRISAALSAFGQQNAMRAPPPGNVSGPSEGQANALANVLNSPTAADALLKRRLGFMLGGR